MSGRDQVYREVLESADEVGADADRFAGELDGLEAGDDLLELDLEGQAGQVDPEADSARQRRSCRCLLGMRVMS